MFLTACVHAERPASSSLLKTLFGSLKPYRQQGDEEHAQVGPKSSITHGSVTSDLSCSNRDAFLFGSWSIQTLQISKGSSRFGFGGF